MVRAKKFVKAGIGLTGATIGLGVGANIAEGITPGSSAGIANLSRALPPTGTIIGAGITLGTLKDLTDSTKGLKSKKKGMF